MSIPISLRPSVPSFLTGHPVTTHLPKSIPESVLTSTTSTPLDHYSKLFAWRSLSLSPFLLTFRHTPCLLRACRQDEWYLHILSVTLSAFDAAEFLTRYAKDLASPAARWKSQRIC